MINTHYFLTGTSTDIGKTYISHYLLKELRQMGRPFFPLKPAMSGFAEDQWVMSDAGQLMHAVGLEMTKGNLDIVSPWRYSAPLAPDLAARVEGQQLLYPPLLEYCRKIISHQSTWLEGAGGIMSPIAEGHTCLDLAADLGLPILLVTGTYLGAISHCLTALSAIQSRNCEIAAVVVNQSDSGDMEAFFAHLSEFIKDIPLFSIHRPGKAEEFQKLAVALTF